MKLSYEHFRHTREVTLWTGEAYMSKGLRLSVYPVSSMGQHVFIGGDDGEVGISTYAGFIGVTLELREAVKRWEKKLIGWDLFLNEGATFADRVWDMLLTLDLYADANDLMHRHKILAPLRWLPGASRYEVRQVEKAKVVVPMVEGNYPAMVTINRVRWTRPRWFSTPWFWRGEIEIPGGIPLPGKGENSWDCEDDATHAISFAVQDYPLSVEDVVVMTITDMVQHRSHHGASLDWKPDAGWPPHMQSREG